MSEIFETIMIICFGFSWPMAIIKSYRSRTTKGKSLPFLLLIETGYVAGIASKLFSNNITYVLVFYTLNLIMVLIDILLYFRNLKIDKSNEL